ncbi:hypothetical protein, partial [Parabacteroides sp. OF04-13BH]|uniref:hypothetical protein n=1 Tax=Parabacteroides sp. OF04-13BH TaxID=2293124 RepID=UPI0035111604
GFRENQLLDDVQTAEKGNGGMRNREAYLLPLRKTWRIFFLVKIQVLAIFRSLIGNDLETSKILYFTSFCSNSKERFS